MKILIIDGQGGGIGASLVKKIKQKDENIKLMGLATNYFATKAMKNAGCDIIASGENAIVVNSRDADIILGPIGIILADSLYGEITEKISSSIARSQAKKILIPNNSCSTYIPQTTDSSIGDLIDEAVDILFEIRHKNM